MGKQLEHDVCQHLRERIRDAVIDHFDTCERMEISRDTGMDMAMAMLIGELQSLAHAAGGTNRDLRELCALIFREAGVATR